MAEINIGMDIFVRRVLMCFKEQRLTAEEVREIYSKLYPPTLVERALRLPHVDVIKIKTALSRLVKEDFVHKELTIFTDHLLKKDTEIFWLANKGRSFLITRK